MLIGAAVNNSLTAAEDGREPRVLVTGADGFMGSALIDRLLACDVTVGALVRRTSRSGIRGHLRNLAYAYDSLSVLIHADVAEVDWYAQAMAFQPTTLVHLAADAYVPASLSAPREVLRANMTGTLNALEYCRIAPAVRRVIIISSSEVYGPCERPIPETFIPHPTTPYAASKLGADRLAYSYWCSFQTPIVICRLFNTYGPRHPYDVIPRFLRATLLGDPVTINGDGDQSRDFMYVDDAVDGLLKACSEPHIEGEVFNFGTGLSTTINELADLVSRVTGIQLHIVRARPRPGEVHRLQCDASKARRVLGWAPQTALEDGVRRCWEWTLANRDYLAGLEVKTVAPD